MPNYEDKYKLKINESESVYSPDNLNTLSSAFAAFADVNKRIKTEFNDEKKYYENEGRKLKAEVSKSGNGYYIWKINKIYDDSEPEQKAPRVKKVASERKIFFDHLDKKIGMNRRSDSILTNLNVDDKDTKEYLVYFRNTAIDEKESMDNFIREKKDELGIKEERDTNKGPKRDDYDEEKGETIKQYRDRMKRESKSRNLRLSTLNEEEEENGENKIWKEFAGKSKLESEKPNLIDKNVVNGLMVVSGKIRKDSGILSRFQKGTPEAKFQRDISEISKFFPVFEVNYKNMISIYNKIKESGEEIQAKNFEGIDEIRKFCSGFDDEGEVEDDDEEVMDDEDEDEEEENEDSLQDRVAQIQRARLKNCLEYHEDSMQIFLNRIICTAEQMYDQYRAIGNDLKQNTKNSQLEKPEDSDDFDDQIKTPNDQKIDKGDEGNFFERIASGLAQKAVMAKDKLVQKVMTTGNNLYTTFDSVRNKEEKDDDDGISGGETKEKEDESLKQGLSEKLGNKINSVSFFIERFQNTWDSGTRQQSQAFLAKLMKTANTQLKEVERQIANRKNETKEKDDNTNDKTEQNPVTLHEKAEKAEEWKKHFRNSRAQLILIYECADNVKPLKLPRESLKIQDIKNNVFLDLKECDSPREFNTNFLELKYTNGSDVDKIENFLEEMPALVKDIENCVDKFEKELLDHLRNFKKNTNESNQQQSQQTSNQDIQNNDVYFSDVISNFGSDLEDLKNNKDVAKRNNKNLNELRSEERYKAIIYYKAFIEKQQQTVNKQSTKIPTFRVPQTMQAPAANIPAKANVPKQFSGQPRTLTDPAQTLSATPNAPEEQKEYKSEIAANKAAREKARIEKNEAIAQEIEKLKNNFKNLYRPKLFIVYDFTNKYLWELKTRPIETKPEKTNPESNAPSAQSSSVQNLVSAIGKPVQPDLIQVVNNSAKAKLERLKLEIVEIFNRISNYEITGEPNPGIIKMLGMKPEIYDKVKKLENSNINSESKQQIIDRLRYEDAKVNALVEDKIQILKSVLKANETLLYQFNSDIEDISANRKERKRNGESFNILFGSDYKTIAKELSREVLEETDGWYRL